MPKLILLGCGGVGSAFLEILKGQKLPFTDIVIIDPRQLDEPILRTVEHTHVQIEITEDNLVPTLEAYVSAKDIIVDVSYNIHCKPLIMWCLSHDVMYINTSMERWPIEDEHLLDGDRHQLEARSLMTLHKMAVKLGEDNPDGPTIVLEHGMNPGLISHFTKLAIQQIASDVIIAGRHYEQKNNERYEALCEAHAEDDFARMAMFLGLRVVHCSERDTQTPLVPRSPGEFLNTWGSYSLYSEGVDPVQIGYGTHEDPNPHQIDNQIITPERGAFTYAESYVPTVGIIKGMVISHGENDTINRMLTVKEENKVVYAPTNFYVYSPADVAWESMEEVKQNGYKMLTAHSSLRGYQLEKGYDAVGALLIFESNPTDAILKRVNSKPVSYWCGSILSLKQTREMGISYAGPTTVQVAISLCAALRWMLKNPRESVCFPEDLPYEQILKESASHLGVVFSGFVPYSPSTLKLAL